MVKLVVVVVAAAVAVWVERSTRPYRPERDIRVAPRVVP